MITNYTDLQQAITNWLDRTDLSARIPEFIQLFESQLRRRSEIEFTKLDEMTIQSELEVLPGDLRELLSLYFDDGIRQGDIEISTPERIASYQGRFRGIGLTVGVPQYAAVVDNSTSLLVAPTPDQAYVVKRIYNTKLDALSGTVATNWVLDDYPDLYLYGSLVEAEPFLKNDERVPLWKSKTEEGLAQLGEFIERRKWSGSTLVMRPKRVMP